MSHPHLLAVIAAASLAAFSFQASAANVAESKAVLSKLAYQVTDLDKSDGVPASLAFNLSSYEGTTLNAFSQDGQGNVIDPQPGGFVSGSVFANTSLTKSGVNGIAAKNGTTLSASTSYSATEAATLLNAPYQPTTWLGEPNLFYKRNADVSAWGSLGLSGLPFTLAAHSSVVFSGQIDLQTSVDLTTLLNSPAYAKAIANQASLFVNASAYVDVTLQTPFLDTPENPSDGPQYASFGNSISLILDPQGHQFRDGDLSPLTTTFTITYSNTSDHEVTKVLNYSINSNVVLGVSPIPEPATWATMALGLGLMAWRIKAQRA